MSKNSNYFSTLVLKATNKDLGEIQWDINLQIVDEILKNPDENSKEILKHLIQRLKTEDENQLIYTITVIF
jgi:hypothetical protein